MHVLQSSRHINAISCGLAHHFHRGTHKFIVCFRHGAKPRNAALVSLPAAWCTGTDVEKNRYVHQKPAADLEKHIGRWDNNHLSLAFLVGGMNAFSISQQLWYPPSLFACKQTYTFLRLVGFAEFPNWKRHARCRYQNTNQPKKLTEDRWWFCKKTKTLIFTTLVNIIEAHHIYIYIHMYIYIYICDITFVVFNSGTALELLPHPTTTQHPSPDWDARQFEGKSPSLVLLGMI